MLRIIPIETGRMDLSVAWFKWLLHIMQLQAQGVPSVPAASPSMQPSSRPLCPPLTLPGAGVAHSSSSPFALQCQSSLHAGSWCNSSQTKFINSTVFPALFLLDDIMHCATLAVPPLQHFASLQLPGTQCSSPALHLQDVVETHLLREIAVRSDNFFEAASVVADLRACLLRTYQQVVGLRSTVAAVDADVVHAADTVQVTPCPIIVGKGSQNAGAQARRTARVLLHGRYLYIINYHG